MAKRKTKDAETPQEAKTIAVTSERTIRSLLKSARATYQNVRAASGEFGQEVKDAIENKHLHRKAFSITRGLDRLEPEKLAECLDHLDHYLEVGGLRARAKTAPRLELVHDADADEQSEAAE